MAPGRVRKGRGPARPSMSPPLPIHDESSESLAAQARAGSKPAFAELVARYEAPLFNFLLMRVRTAEDAEELTQDTFLRAWRKLDLYRSEWKFSTWLFTLARHLAASRLRAPTRHVVGRGDERAGLPPSRSLRRAGRHGGAREPVVAGRARADARPALGAVAALRRGPHGARDRADPGPQRHGRARAALPGASDPGTPPGPRGRDRRRCDPSRRGLAAPSRPTHHRTRRGTRPTVS
jgi:RNA polymerase sigma factor (sigma-70 family)